MIDLVHDGIFKLFFCSRIESGKVIQATKFQSQAVHVLARKVAGLEVITGTLFEGYKIRLGV